MAPSPVYWAGGWGGGRGFAHLPSFNISMGVLLSTYRWEDGGPEASWVE